MSQGLLEKQKTVLSTCKFNENNQLATKFVPFSLFCYCFSVLFKIQGVSEGACWLPSRRRTKQQQQVVQQQHTSSTTTVYTS
jgi:hypothetical protein